MLIARYIIPEGNVVWINTRNCSDYALLVKDARTLLGESSSLNSFIACLEDADKVSGVFDSIWPLIESGDVEPFRDFMISDDVISLYFDLDLLIVTNDVISLKEYLISGEDQYLELEMENAFCQEGIVMTLEDNLWTYHFPDFSENPATKGVITLQLTYDEVQAAEEAKAEIAEQAELESEESAIEDASEDVSEDASEDVSEDAVEDDSNDDFENASKDASENASNGASEDASKDASEDASEDNSEDETDLEENAEEDEEVIRSGKISMNYEPSVSGGTYFPHVTYYLTCEYEGELVNYTYQEVITSEDGTKTRTTISNWGDEELEEEEDTSSDNVTTQPAQTNEEPAATTTTPNVIVDPETGAMYDPNTGLQIDPGTGFYIDPATGLYIDPNTWTYIDPATGAVVDPNAAAQTPDAATPEAAPDAAAQGAGA